MTDPVETLARALIGGDELCDPLTCGACNDARKKARTLLAQITPALVAEQNKSLTDGIREAIRLAEQPHYGDSDTALEHYSEAIDILRKLV